MAFLFTLYTGSIGGRYSFELKQIVADSPDRPSTMSLSLIHIFPQGDDLVARIQSLPLALLQEDSPGYQNRVSLLEGRMPAGPGECVLDVSKIADQGVEVGDVLTLSPDNADLSDTLALSAFTVVGKVESATYFSIEREPSAVGNGTVSLIFYTGDDAFSLDVYTDLYILVEDVYKRQIFLTISAKERLTSVVKDTDATPSTPNSAVATASWLASDSSATLAVTRL